MSSELKFSPVPEEALSRLRAGLYEHFGFEDFNEGQDLAVYHVTHGRDVLVIMPTGAGKSLCYQLSALLSEGLSLVISPLISLMKDQVDALAARGIQASFINSSISRDEARRRLVLAASGGIRILYIAPERFRDKDFMAQMEASEVGLIAVDEAHCVSQWGHDFRPDYLRLRQVLAKWPQARVTALTATATPQVREDIIRELGLGQGGREAPVELVFGFARDNLHIRVRRCANHDEKLRRLRETASSQGTGIVYAATRKHVEYVHSLLEREGVGARMYHGGMTENEREDAQNAFMKKQVDIVVATNAFGMGIDRNDVRFVVHWDIPGSLEAYYQEIGRAGRDGQDAVCELLYNYADVRTQEFFIEGSNPDRTTVLAVWQVVRDKLQSGPVTCPVREWEAAVSLKGSKMGVGTSLFMLERAGLIRREMPSGRRMYQYSLQQGGDERNLTALFPALEKKRSQDEKKLHAVVQYAGTARCRHRAVLQYFGEDLPPGSCGLCDVCVREAGGNVRPPDEAEWLEVQKALSCAGRLNGAFGLVRVVQILRGSEAKAIVQQGLHRLSTYGALHDRSEAYVRHLLDQLIHAGCLVVTPGEYPKLKLTSLGREVAWRKTEVSLEWPGDRKKTVAERSLGQDGKVDEALFGRLRSWRSAEAERRGQPPFMVLGDKSLRAVAAAKPRTTAELGMIWGIGPHKAKAFGSALLELISRG